MKTRLSHAEVKKKILVIGGGPAGMEAAFVAKRKGHHVILCEQSDALGGLMKLAAVPIAKQDLSRVIEIYGTAALCRQVLKYA